MATEDYLVELAGRHGGYWGQHPKYPVEDWRYEVSCDYTRKSYWEWVRDKVYDEMDSDA